MSILDESTINDALAELPGWRLDGDHITREYRFKGFREAIEFINRIADAAEAADHHPELTNVYSTVTVALTSHDAGGITEKDLKLAREIEAASR